LTGLAANIPKEFTMCERALNLLYIDHIDDERSYNGSLTNCPGGCKK